MDLYIADPVIGKVKAVNNMPKQEGNSVMNRVLKVKNEANDDEKKPKATQQKTKSHSDAPPVKNILIDPPVVKETPVKVNKPENQSSSDGKAKKASDAAVQKRTKSDSRQITNSGNNTGNGIGSFYDGAVTFITNNNKAPEATGE